MPRQISDKKRHVRYAEYKDVMEEIKRIAEEQGVTPTEVLRDAVLAKANAHRKTTGKPKLKSAKEREEEDAAKKK